MPKIRRKRKAPKKVKTWTCRECGQVAKSRRTVCLHIVDKHAETVAETMTTVGERAATPEPMSLVVDVMRQASAFGNPIGVLAIALCCFDDLKNENDVVVVRELLHTVFNDAKEDGLLGGHEAVPETLEAFIEASTFKKLKACYDQCVRITRSYRYGGNLDRVYDEHWWWHLIKLAGKAGDAINKEIRRRKAAKLAELE